LTIDSIDVDKALNSARQALADERDTAPALAAAMDTLLLLVSLLISRLGLDSSNSSQPPSADPNRKKKRRAGAAPRRPGGQPGHTGTTLTPVAEPDEIVSLSLDRQALPPGRHWRRNGVEKRQVFDVVLQRQVTEYQAEVWVDDQGQRRVADFPSEVGQAVQYGPTCKAHAVYLSQYQLLPYARVCELFADQLGIPLSSGTLANFNREAAALLGPFEQTLKARLPRQNLLHVDETSVNIDGQRVWLHTAGNARLTHYAVHGKRGQQAMEAIDILPHFTGVLCHDHWKPYYRYTDCQHALCNSHHLRELQRVVEQDDQQWAQQLQDLLIAIRDATDAAGGALSPAEARDWRQKYRQIIAEGDRECPAPSPSASRPKRRGRLKRSKARNLLERLRDYEADVLRFMEQPEVPFTNNAGERAIRMTKVQQKVSGCFRSWEGAEGFCRIRSYLATCRNHAVSASESLLALFRGQAIPAFMHDEA
jgi:transposase